MHTASNDTGTTSPWDAVFANVAGASAEGRHESDERWAAIARQFVATVEEQWGWIGYVTPFLEALLRERGYTLKELQDGTKIWRSQ